MVCGGEVWEDKIDQTGLMRNVINGRDKNFNRKKPEHEFLEPWMRREICVESLLFLAAPSLQTAVPAPKVQSSNVLLSQKLHL